ncbi:DUF2505 domain-containing protein [Desertihabitans brevis]|uniref:DUF2505 domain-containing protein n=1 Tax=Desertihabitans brevis TaxID=2268447 RepID=A0A367YZK3_9ACTN|nr:DUF2505 domain-containing protein [Desertihabitans brevis]RCK70929.1 DUF2505 domain-containing protein [Desertihabitans brevis]
MDISTRAEFPADPAETFTMLTDEAYLNEVCEASDARSYSVAVDGTTTRTTRVLEAPSAAAKFTGPTLEVVEEISWGAAEADGSRRGTVSITVPGQPVVMNGSAVLAPGGGGSVFEMSGDLKVNIPLLGRKLEQSAAPAVLAAVQTHEEVGRRWLARG